MPDRLSSAIIAISSARSMAGLLGRAQTIVAGAVGGRLDPQPQSGRYLHRRWLCDVVAAGEDVQDHVAAARPVLQRLVTGSLHGIQAVGQDGAEDRHELPVGLVR